MTFQLTMGKSCQMPCMCTGPCAWVYMCVRAHMYVYTCVCKHMCRVCAFMCTASVWTRLHTRSVDSGRTSMKEGTWKGIQTHHPLCRQVWIGSWYTVLQWPSVQFSSVAQPCPTLCNLMNHSIPGLPIHHQLPEFTQTHAHWVGDAIQPFPPLSSPSPPTPNPSQHQGLFQWVNSSHEVAKVLEFQLQHQSF